MDTKNYIWNKILEAYDKLIFVYYRTHNRLIGTQKGSLMIARGFDTLSGLFAWTLFFYMFVRWRWGMSNYYASGILAGWSGGVWGAGITLLHKSFASLRKVLFLKTIRDIGIITFELFIILFWGQIKITSII